MSPLTLAILFASIGAYGLITRYGFGLGDGPSIIVSVAGGLATAYAVARAAAAMIVGARGTSAIKADAFVGSRGEVITSIPAGGVGEVALLLDNRRYTSPARSVDYASLRDVNPRLVCATLTGFGRSGPRAADPAYDYLIQGLAGFMHVTGEPGHPPVRSDVAVIDFAGGLASALGLMIALLRARETGVGGDVDVSLHDVAISMLTHLATAYLNTGIEPARLPGGSHPSVVPSQTFATQDGWMLVMCMKEKFWRRLCGLLARADLADHDHYADFDGRLAHRVALVAELEAIFRRRPTAEWIALLQGQVPCAPVNSLADALADPQVAHRDMVVSVDHPALGPLREVGCPITIDDVVPVYRPAPLLGADTDAILRSWLGLGADEIGALRRAGAV